MYTVTVCTNHHTNYEFEYPNLASAREFATATSRNGLWLSAEQAPDGVETFYSPSAIHAVKIVPPAAPPTRRKSA